MNWPIDPSRRRAVPVAALALGLALGSAGVATASGLSTHTVKKIATKVVTKKAPKLSVAHAETAGDATTLAGQPAGAFLGRVVAKSLSTAVPLDATGTQTLIGPLPLTVPTGAGFVLVSGQAYVQTVGPSGAFLGLYYAVDAACNLSSPEAQIEQVGHTNAGVFDAVSFSALRAVTPGSHTFRLCAEGGGTGSAVHPGLIISTVGDGTIAP